MRKWGYGINSCRRTASIYVEEAPFGIFALEWLFDNLCWLIPSISLPSIPIRLWDKESIEFNDDQKWTTLGDWWGDLNQLFHGLIHTPISNYCWRKRTFNRVVVADYDKLRDIFYEKDRKLWDENEQFAREIDDEA